MEQTDYILKEIEKVGVVLKAIRQKLLHDTDNLSISIEKHIGETKERLRDELFFDFDKIFLSDAQELDSYFNAFNGFNTDNIERLAEYVSQIGFIDNNSARSKEYLKKALQLYDFCRQKSKTYSFEREEKIAAIKNAL